MEGEGMEGKGMDRNGDSPPLSAPAELSKVMREFGISANPSDPRLAKLVASGATLAMVRDACSEAKYRKRGAAIPPGYVIATIEGKMADAAAMALQPARASPTAQTFGKAGRATAEAAAAFLADISGQTK